MLKKVKCTGCGKKFPPLKENAYQTMSTPTVFRGDTHKSVMAWSHVDCPQCGTSYELGFTILPYSHAGQEGGRHPLHP